jgi:hypothetical protein
MDAQVPLASPRRASSDAVALKPTSGAIYMSTNKDVPRLLSEPSDYLLRNFSSSLLSSPLISPLDPFFPLPCKTTPRERSLLHFYLITMPGAFHNTHSKAAFCPIRDTRAVAVQVDQTFLQWVVVAAEIFLLQGRQSPAAEPHILSRKAYIYRLMNKAIANPDTRYSNNTLATTAAAGILESRSGNPVEGRKHLIALRHLIEGRGGSNVLQDMLFGQAMVITVGFLGTGTHEATFVDEVRLKRAIESFNSTFQAMQSWNQSLRVEFEKSYESDVSSPKVDMATDTLSSLSDILYVSNIRDLERYRSSRRKVFGKTSFLHKYIEPRRANTSECKRRSHFAVLWIINKLIYDLRHDHQKSKEFIESFLNDVISGEIPSGNRNSSPAAGTPLNPITLVYILAASAAKHTPKFSGRGGILHSWDAIDPLELMELATKDSQEEVTALLSSWLTNDECDIFYIADSRIEDISNEIEKEWLRRQHPR